MLTRAEELILNLWILNIRFIWKFYYNSVYSSEIIRKFYSWFKNYYLSFPKLNKSHAIKLSSLNVSSNEHIKTKIKEKRRFSRISALYKRCKKNCWSSSSFNFSSISSDPGILVDMKNSPASSTFLRLERVDRLVLLTRATSESPSATTSANSQWQRVNETNKRGKNQWSLKETDVVHKRGRGHEKEPRKTSFWASSGAFNESWEVTKNTLLH